MAPRGDVVVNLAKAVMPATEQERSHLQTWAAYVLTHFFLIRCATLSCGFVCLVFKYQKVQKKQKSSYVNVVVCLSSCCFPAQHRSCLCDLLSGPKRNFSSFIRKRREIREAITFLSIQLWKRSIGSCTLISNRCTGYINVKNISFCEIIFHLKPSRAAATLSQVGLTPVSSYRFWVSPFLSTCSTVTVSMFICRKMPQAYIFLSLPRTCVKVKALLLTDSIQEGESSRSSSLCEQKTSERHSRSATHPSRAAHAPMWPLVASSQA